MRDALIFLAGAAFLLAALGGLGAWVYSMLATRHSRFFLCVALAACAVGVCAIAGAARAQDCVEGAYGCNHAQDHEQFKTWHREDHADPDGIVHRGFSCCNEHDCRPTRAYQDQKGNWHAWLGRRWAKVPQEALLKADILGTGRSYVCAPQVAEDYEVPAIYCFSPGQTRF